jgi:hypothetical protein
MSNLEKSKIMIELDYSLKELKTAYREYHGLKASERVSKRSIAVWLASLVQADIQ